MGVHLPYLAPKFPWKLLFPALIYAYADLVKFLKAMAVKDLGLLLECALRLILYLICLFLPLFFTGFTRESTASPVLQVSARRIEEDQPCPDKRNDKKCALSPCSAQGAQRQCQPLEGDAHAAWRPASSNASEHMYNNDRGVQMSAVKLSPRKEELRINIHIQLENHSFLHSQQIS